MSPNRQTKLMLKLHMSPTPVDPPELAISARNRSSRYSICYRRMSVRMILRLRQKSLESILHMLLTSVSPNDLVISKGIARVVIHPLSNFARSSAARTVTGPHLFSEQSELHSPERVSRASWVRPFRRSPRFRMLSTLGWIRKVPERRLGENRCLSMPLMLRNRRCYPFTARSSSADVFRLFFTLESRIHSKSFVSDADKVVRSVGRGEKRFSHGQAVTFTSTENNGSPGKNRENNTGSDWLTARATLRTP